jgi:hypothetical protein
MMVSRPGLVIRYNRIPGRIQPCAERICLALGDAYPFTHRGGMTRSTGQLASVGFNRSLIHVDLPLDTREVVWSA